MKYYHNIFPAIIQPEPLFCAWEGFKKGKSPRLDVQEFDQNVETHIFALHRDLRSAQYKHGPYNGFMICDPKQRHIHKASVRDRIVHHAVFSVLNPIFEPTFIAHSFSCRKGKGTHKAVDALERMLWKESQNNTRTCFVLQCDINKFFDSVSHPVLKSQISKRVRDENVLWLMDEIIDSFSSPRFGPDARKGLPIGNLTSQLFANVYLNALDQFIKHDLKVRHYLRYTDDFAIVSADRSYLHSLIEPIESFLRTHLDLSLHPRKIRIRKYAQGIDFLGYVILPHHRVLRTRTKHRMFRKLHERVVSHKSGVCSEDSAEQSLQSYLGVLSHANTHDLQSELLNRYWFWKTE
ncbi:group II intron reverse transcriptase domain-containing protein [Candidatus Peribacteria bacterium]|nr:group II intron reverse transcriptase domain-containing protein [Candidatus Peribacteria bacterium]